MADIEKANDKDYDGSESRASPAFSIWLQPMRRSIFVAAALAATSLIAPSASKANAPTPMFTVTAASPGAVTFSGSGTASFNNSVGNNNSFQVGSSTNLGVNASTSSTPEYGVTSQADLAIGTGTTLQQTIGTSGVFRNNTSEASSAYEAASSRTATQTVDAMSASGWTADYSSQTESGTRGNRSWTDKKSYEAAYKAEYNATYESKYDSNFQSAYSTVRSNTSSSGTDGVISGSFRTVESGSAQASGNSSDWATSASTTADASWESSYAAYKAKNTSSTMTEATWQSERDSSYNTAYAKSAASSNRYSDSAVTVRGIGSDAKVSASADSNFTVDIKASSPETTGSTATANGSAGANLATSSFANQSQSSTASAFMQAFGN